MEEASTDFSKSLFELFYKEREKRKQEHLNKKINKADLIKNLSQETLTRAKIGAKYYPDFIAYTYDTLEPFNIINMFLNRLNKHSPKLKRITRKDCVSLVEECRENDWKQISMFKKGFERGGCFDIFDLVLNDVILIIKHTNEKINKNETCTRHFL